MSALPWLAVLLPLLGAVAAMLWPSIEVAAWLSIAAATGAFAMTVALPTASAGYLMLGDPLAVLIAALTAFVAMAGAWLARPWWRLELAAGRATGRTVRRGHALASALLGSLLLALLADDLPLAWGGTAFAVLLLVAALRLGGATIAAWRLFVVAGAGLGLALAGILLLALAARPIVEAPSLRWTVLAEVAPQCHGPLLALAFAFLVLGNGTLAGLVPLHAGMIGAQAEGPAPLTGWLGALLPGVALVTILRARALLAANPDATSPGPPLLALGLLSLLLAAPALWRERDPRRSLAIAGSGQVGVIALAFGIGTGAATFAGVLHLTLLTLIRAASAQLVARAAQMRPEGGPGGLLVQHRALGLTLAAGLVALAALPPFGLFTSTFLIVMETVRQAPPLAVPLGLGLVGCAGALAARLLALCREPRAPNTGPAPPPAALLPAWLLLAVALLLGLAMPGALVDWLAKIAEAMR